MINMIVGKIGNKWHIITQIKGQDAHFERLFKILKQQNREIKQIAKMTNDEYVHDARTFFSNFDESRLIKESRKMSTESKPKNLLEAMIKNGVPIKMALLETSNHKTEIDGLADKIAELIQDVSVEVIIEDLKTLLRDTLNIWVKWSGRRKNRNARDIITRTIEDYVDDLMEGSKHYDHRSEVLIEIEKYIWGKIKGSPEKK